MYTVIVGEQTRKSDLDRDAAVEQAKRMSQRTYEPVRVLHDRKFERLVFRRGSLQESVFVTRDRRSRRGPLS